MTPRLRGPLGPAAATILLLASALPFARATAACAPVEVATLTASDEQALDLLGWAVAIAGDTIVAGSVSDDLPGAVDAGSARVFARMAGTWSEEALLAASDAAAGDSFGWAVAVSGDTAVVGARLDDHAGGGDAGSAYVFVRTAGTWTQQAKLTASDAAANDLFGSSVAIDGDTIVVGSPGDDHGAGAGAGSAYVFERVGVAWTQSAKLVASDGAAADALGGAIALHDDTIVAGATGDDNAGGGDAGAAYVFVRILGLWSEEGKLVAGDAAGADAFGTAVAVSADTALVGAELDNNAGGTDAGSAYVFTRTAGAWSEEAKLVAAAGEAFSAFGHAVAIDGDTALVGTRWDDEPAGQDAGSVSVFTRVAGAWSEDAKIVASDAQPFDDFGNAVGVSGDTFVVGVHLDDTVPVNAGSVRVLECPSASPPSCAPAAGPPACGLVTLDAGATDPDDDVVSVVWTSADCPDAVITPDPLDLDLAEALVFPACRECTFEVTVTDASDLSCAGAVAVDFDDREPPVVAPRAGDEHCLWPPNHRWACFTRDDFAPVVTDACSATWRFASCASSQAADATGDGHTDVDCAVSPDGQAFCVRAERDGGDPAGRVYAIGIEAVDDCGNATLADIGVVRVPHDQSPRAADCRGPREALGPHDPLPWEAIR